jgi:hypothetical protein
MAKLTLEEKLAESLRQQQADEAELREALERAKKKRLHGELALRDARRRAWGTRMDELGLLALPDGVLEDMLKGLAELQNNGNSNKAHGIKTLQQVEAGREG